MWYGITIGQVRFEKAGGQLRKTDQKQGFVQGAMILMIGTVTVKVVSMLFKIPISNMLGVLCCGKCCRCKIFLNLSYRKTGSL